MPFSAGDECFRHHRRRLQLEALARRSLEPEQRWRWVEKVAVQRLGYFRSDGYDSGHGCGIRNEPRNASFLQCSALPPSIHSLMHIKMFSCLSVPLQHLPDRRNMCCGHLVCFCAILLALSSSCVRFGGMKLQHTTVPRLGTAPMSHAKTFSKWLRIRILRQIKPMWEVMS